MPTLNQVRNVVDNWLSDRWPTVTGRQDTYFNNNGKYWQGLITHTNSPAFTTTDDGSSLPDLLNNHPTDQSSSWANAIPTLTGLFPACLKMDVYDGPLGQGYVATVFVYYNGTLYTRSQNVGPETSRTNPWAVVDLG